MYYTNTALHRRPPRMAMDIFKSLPEGTRVQLIEDKIVMEPAPVFLHQDIAADIYIAICLSVKQRDLGKVVFAPVDVYLDRKNAFQPDIIYISRERMGIIGKKGLYGAPDLIVEILSPSTSRYDRRDKKNVYERSGVKEYWLVDPATCIVQGYRLINEVFHALPPAKNVIRSVLLGDEFWFSC